MTKEATTDDAEIQNDCKIGTNCFFFHNVRIEIRNENAKFHYVFHCWQFEGTVSLRQKLQTFD